MMSGEVTVVPQCRAGLAPTVSLNAATKNQAANATCRGREVPWVATCGSHAWPVVITACSCRRIGGGDDGLGLRRGELVRLPGRQVLVARGVDVVATLGSPDRPPGGQAQGGSALAGEFRAADERAG